MQQTDGQQIDGQADRQEGRQMSRYINGQTDVLMEMQTFVLIDRWTGEWMDRQMG